MTYTQGTKKRLLSAPYRMKLYRTLRRIPIIKKYAFRIVMWIWPPSHEDWERLMVWIKENVIDKETP